MSEEVKTSDVTQVSEKYFQILAWCDYTEFNIEAKIEVKDKS